MLRALGLLFAEAEVHTGVSLTDVGMVVTALATILLVIDRVKTIFWPTKPMQEEYVRKGELDELKTKMESFVTRLELQRLEAQINTLSQDQKDLGKTTTAKYEDMCKSIGEVRLTIEQVRREVHIEVNQAADKIIGRILQQMHINPHQEA